MRKKLSVFILTLMTMSLLGGILSACSQEHVHSMTPTPQVAATCLTDGNSAYWYCADCGKYFSDEEGNTEIAENSWVIAALGHDVSGAEWEHNDSEHWQTCVRCEEKVGKAAHTGGNATCTSEAVCEVCGASYGELAAHSYTEQNTDSQYLKSAATCTQAAVYYYSCECGAKGSETFEYGELAAHSYTEQNTDSQYLKSAATCTHKAVYYYSCECGAKGSETFEYGELAAHSYTEQNTDSQYLKSAATCTHKAVYYYSCECGAKGSETFEYGELAAHSYTEQNTDSQYLKSAATCTHKAVYYYSCECGAKGSETFEYGEALGHDMEHIAAAPATCTAAGNSEYWHCKTCDLYFSDAEGENEIAEGSWTIAASHDMTHTAAVAETCTTAGNSEYWHCDACDMYFSDEAGENEIAEGSWTIAALGHDTDGVEWSHDGTSHYKVCARCQEHIDVAAHTGGTATCTAQAICQVCGAPYGEREAHEYIVEDTSVKYLKSAATCTQRAVYFYSCECGQRSDKTFEYGELASHNYDKKIADSRYLKSAATCTAKAVYFYSCECGAKGEDTFESGTILGHDTDGAEWSHDGTSHYKVCARCQEHIDVAAHTGGTATCTALAECEVCNQAYGSLLPHSYIVKNTEEQYLKSAATCTQAAVYYYSCECGAKGEDTFEYGNAAGHEYEKTVVEPTCTQVGYTLNTCKVCPITMRSDEVPMLEHQSSGEATCTQPETCTVCGTVLTEATGHAYDSAGLQGNGCTEDVVETFSCGKCGDEYTVIAEHARGSHTVESWTSSDPVHDDESSEVCRYLVTSTGECTHCHEEVTKTEAIYKHSYIRTVTTAATCKTEGEYTYTCSAVGCNHSYTEKYSDSEAHVWNAGTLSGTLTVYNCTLCDATKQTINSNGATSAEVSGTDVKEVGEIELQGATFGLDDTTKQALSENNEQMTFSAESVASEEIELDDADKQKLGEDAAIYSFTITSGDSTITSFNKGIITVRIPYSLREGESADSIIIWYIADQPDESGSYLTAIEAKWEKDASGETSSEGIPGWAVFETDHFSRFSVSKISAEERCKVFGHTWVYSDADPTCTEQGYTKNICTICGENEISYIPALGHDYQPYEEGHKDATCTMGGYDVNKCSRCPNEIKVNLTAATGHKWAITEIKAPTCMETGLEGHTCTNDGCSEYEEVTIAALGHDLVKQVVEPSCTAGGYTVVTCAREGCDLHYIEDETPATGHRYIAKLVAPTCTEDGYTQYTCANCGDSYISDIVRAEGHKWDISAPTCGRGQKCTACGSMGLPATGRHQMSDKGYCTVCKMPCTHEFGEYVFNDDATCTYNGTMTAVCQICGMKDTVSVGGVPSGHNMQERRVEPTCTMNGYVSEVCTVCGYEERGEILYSEGHDYVGGICTVCGEEQSDFRSIYVNMAESLLNGNYVLKVDDFEGALNKVYEGGTTEEYIATVYRIGDASISFSRDGISMYMYGVIDIEYADPSYPVTEQRYFKIVIQDGKLYGEEGTIVNGKERVGSINVSPVDYVLSSFTGTMFGDMITELKITEIIGWYEDSVKPIFGAIRAENERALHEIFGRLVDTYAKSVETAYGYDFALDMSAIKELWNAMGSKKACEVVDMLGGEGSWQSLTSFVRESLSKKVSVAVDELISYCEGYSLELDDIYSSIEQIIYIMSGEECDINELVANNGDITIEEFIKQLFGMPSDMDLGAEAENIIALLEENTLLEAVDTITGADNSVIWNMTGAIVESIQNGFSLTISIDKTGVVTSLDIALDGWYFDGATAEGEAIIVTGTAHLIPGGGTIEFPYPEMVTSTEELIDSVFFAEAKKSDHGNDISVDGYTIVNDSSSETNRVGSDGEYEGQKCLVENVVYSHTSVTLDIRTAETVTISYDCGDWIRLSYSFNNARGTMYTTTEVTYISLDDGSVLHTEVKQNDDAQPYESANWYINLYYNRADGTMDNLSHHSYVLKDKVVPSSCNSYGKNTYRCENCGDEYYTIESCGHDPYTVYELMPGSETCEDGVYEKSVCRICSEILYVVEQYDHLGDMIENSYNTECGSVVITHSRCACGQVSDVNVDGHDCKLEGTTQEIPNDSGYTDFVTTYTCQNEECGFRYIVTESTQKVGCRIVTDTLYQFVTLGIELTARDEGEYDHAMQPDKANGRVETVEDGNRKVVETEKYVCEVCGAREERISERIYAPDGSEIYSKQTNISVNEDGITNGDVSEFAYNEYGQLTLTYSCQILGGRETWHRSEIVYDGCMATETTTDSYGYTYVDTYESHAYEDIYALVDGATSCEDGVRHSLRCAKCGIEDNVTYLYAHVEFSDKQIIATECGDIVLINTSCPCGQIESIRMDSSSCNFLEETTGNGGALAEYGYEDYTTVYTCEKCGYSYTQEHRYTKEGCNVFDNVTCRFDGVDGETTYVVDNQISLHNLVGDDGVTNNYTDENGNRVTEFREDLTCSECGYREYNSSVTVTSPEEVVLRSENEYGSVMSDGTVKKNYTLTICDESGRTLEDYEKHITENGEYWTRREYSYNGCEVTERWTDSEGNSDTRYYTDHIMTERYELAEGATSCEYGVNIIYCCERCGYVESTKLTYEHVMYESVQTIQTSCGIVRVLNNRCACGLYEDINVEHDACNVEKSENVEGGACEQYGYSDFDEIFECMNDGCDFAYTVRHRYSKDKCTVTENVTYDLSQYGIIYSVEHQRGEIHTNDEQDYSDETSYDQGNRVVKGGYKETCQVCGYVHEYMRTETYNQSDILISLVQDENWSYADGSTSFAHTESTYNADGELVSRYVENTDSSGNTTWNKDSYEYDGCLVTVHSEYSNRDPYTYEEYRHEMAMRYELAEGSTSCVDGVYQITYCTRCGYEENRELRHEHITYIEDYSVHTYCGTVTINVDHCACNENIGIPWIDSNDCTLETRREDVAGGKLEDINYRDYDEITVCQVDECDFIFRAEYRYHRENCRAICVTTYTCEQLPEFNVVVITDMGEAHDFTSETTSSESCDESGNQVVEKITTSVCTICNTEKQVVIQSTCAQSGEPIVYSSETWENGEKVDWYITEYSYDGCYVTVTTTNVDGQKTYTEEKHAWQDEGGAHSCTQHYNIVCEKCGEIRDTMPLGHDMYHDKSLNLYICTRCGLESVKKINGSIMLEDMTEADGEQYVVGYFNRDGVTDVVVSVWAYADDDNRAMLEIGLEDDGVSRVAFSKEEAQQALKQSGVSGDVKIQVCFTGITQEGNGVTFEITLD